MTSDIRLEDIGRASSLGCSLDDTLVAGINSKIAMENRNSSFAVKWFSLFTFTTTRHKMILAIAVFLSFLSGLVLPTMSILMGKIFGAFAKFGSGELNSSGFADEVKFHVLSLTILGFVSWVLHSGFFAAWLFFGELQSKSAKAMLFEVLIDKELSWYETQENGLSAFLSKCQTQITELQAALSQPIGYVTECMVTAIASLCIAFYHSWDLTFVLFSGIPVMFFVMNGLSSRLQPEIDRQKKHISKAVQIAERAISCIDTVKAFNGQSYEQTEFKQAVQQAAEAYHLQARIGAIQTGFIRFTTLIIFVQGFWYGSYQIRNGGQKEAELVMTTFWSCLMASQALELVFPQILLLERGRVAGAELGVLLFKAQKGEVGSFESLAGRMPGYCVGSVEIQNVSFAYSTRQSKLVLSNLNISIPSQKTVFIIGRSGSGKSSLASLIVNAYKPLSGTIFIDGQNTKNLDPRWIRQHISLVQQHSTLFNESIFRNITFGNLEYECISRELVLDACKMVSLEGTIASLPQGIDAEVGVGGRLLSGGQLQRVALAREKLRDATILIMDESLSALDTLNRKKVMKNIRQWRKEKTTIIITHEINEIEKDDFVYILDSGRVVQEGYRRDIEELDGPLRSFIVAPLTHTPISRHTEMGHNILLLNKQYHTNQRTEFFEAQFSIPTPPMTPIIMHANGYKMSKRRPVDRKSNNTTMYLDKHLQRRAEKSSGGRGFTLVQIFLTVWPALSVRSRFMLVCGLGFAILHAAATPVFSFALSRLLSTALDSRSAASDARKWSLIIVGIAIGDSTSCYMFHTLLESSGQSWANHLRVKALSKILSQPCAWFDKGECEVSRLLEDLEKNAQTTQDLLSKFAGYSITCLVTLIIGVSWSLILCWRLTLAGLVIAPMMYLVSRGLGQISDQWERRCKDTAEEMGVILHESITNIWTVRNFSLERYFRQKYFRIIRKSLHIGIKRSLLEGIGSGLSDSVTIFATSIILAYGSVLVSQGTEKLQDVLSVITLLLFSLASTEASISMIPQISSSKESARRILWLVNLSRISHESIGNGRIARTGEIAFHNVSFSYPTRPDVPVLSGLNLTIPEGSCIAIVGASGSGKSTIASLLLRLYSVTSGAITLAGIPLNALSTSNIRSQVTIVSQTPAIFDCSVVDNIIYGLPKDSISSAQVERATRGVGLHQFILELPNGYQTLLGDKGAGLSSGQRQRLAIARALVRQPRILILDECTSNIDAENAKTVRETVVNLVSTKQAGSGCTVLIITHHVELMQAAENIVVLDEGKILEIGNWEKLTKPRGGLEILLKCGSLET